MQERNGVIVEWNATNRQTWAATSYLRMIVFGLFGLNTDTEKISFSPCVPNDFNKIILTNLRVRNMILKIIIKGNGTEIKKITMNGEEMKEAVISLDITGLQTVAIEMNN